LFSTDFLVNIHAHEMLNNILISSDKFCT